jgi:hypothetical protein
MALSAQDALVYLMIVAASSDDAIADQELKRIDTLVGRLPVFEGYDRAGVPKIANQCIDLINGPAGLDGVLDTAIAALPKRLEDTAYALCVELEQEELRLLEMIRDKLSLDRLVTAAIETAARARHRKA